MSRMQETMEKIIETKKMAEKPLDTDNPNLMRALRGKKKRAKEDLNGLFEEYRDLVKMNCAFILVVGKQGEKFANISGEEFDCFVSKATDFYETIVSEINPRLYKDKISGRSLFEVAGTIFENMAMDMGIVGYSPLIFEEKYKKKLKDKTEALDLITRAFNEKIGTEVAAYYSIDRAAQKAIEGGFMGNKIPIVIHGNGELMEEFALKFKNVNKNVFIVTTGRKSSEKLKKNAIEDICSVNQEKVEETLLKIRENL